MFLPCFRYFAFLVECKEPKACTILLRGASKDILNEVERNLQDAMNVARNVMMDASLCPGGGAVEMEVAHVSGKILKSQNYCSYIEHCTWLNFRRRVICTM